MSQSPDPDQEWRPPAPEGAVSSETDQGGSVRYDAPATHPGPGADPYGGQAADRYGTAYAPAPPAAGGSSAPASTIVLLVISGVLLVLTFWSFVGLVWAAPAVLAVVSLTKVATDPAGARGLARTGWWVAAGLAAATVLLVVLVVIAIVAFGLSLPSSTGYDPSTVGLSAALQTLHAAAAR